MADFDFVLSKYNFTDPIRYFKANDPYYYEVDNIPLKQLAENTLWLKDQVENPPKITRIKRADFDELRPYANGNDRKIRVLPGRYTARINDAYDLEPAAYLTKILGTNLGEIDTFAVNTAQTPSLPLAANEALVSLLNTFKLKLSANAQNMNGLFERAFTYPLRTEDDLSSYVGKVTPTVTFQEGQGPFPLSEVMLWAKKDPLIGNYDSVLGSTYDPIDIAHGFDKISFLESVFIKKWRSVTRTAIVDVPTEITVNIPKFEKDDFYYTDEEGVKQILDTATQRIDLVFIYSKPVDAGATTIGEFVGGQPTSITTPQLGIVKGAGIGVDFSTPVLGETSVDGEIDPLPSTDADGNAMIVPNIGDSANNKNGFTGLDTPIHGSFPSPDDLMNQAPLLASVLEGKNYELVGQSILPVAYIVTNSTESIVPSENVIDIRPFFRTTELAYNERAGIAAANPQISFANPVVGKALLDKTAWELKNYIDSIIDTPDEPESPHLVGAGVLFGGIYFGVEGVLTHYELSESIAADIEGAWSVVKQKFGLPASVPAPLYPDWDLGAHAGALSESGFHANDYINVMHNTDDSPAAFASFASDDQVTNGINSIGSTASIYNTSRMPTLGTGNHQGTALGTSILFCSKTIRLDKGDVPWMSDYDVNVDFLNCVPLSQRGVPHENSNNNAGAAGVWVDKRPGEFTIYVAWLANDNIQGVNHEFGIFDSDPTTGRDGNHYAGFNVLTEDLIHHPYGLNPGATSVHHKGESRQGICIYPSVSFQVTGYPATYSGRYFNLNATNPVITLT